MSFPTHLHRFAFDHAIQQRQPEPPLDATVIELTLGEEFHETRYRWNEAAPAAVRAR